MILSYRIELKPNLKQIKQFQQHCGVARYAYNWALQNHTIKVDMAKREAEVLGLEKPIYPKVSSNDWYKQFANLRDTELDWIGKVSKSCWNEALRNLEAAFKRFFDKKGAYPVMKKRGHHDSYKVCATTRVGYDFIVLPKIGKVRLKEHGYATQHEVEVPSTTTKNLLIQN